MSQVSRWEHFNHDADIGVRGYGATLADAFVAAAMALTAVVTDPDTVACREEIDIEVPADDPEWQFFNFLNAIVYEMTTRNMLFGDYQVQLVNGKLLAKARGEPVDRQKHQPAVEIKGATMTELSIHTSPRGWCAQCVVDV